MIDRIEKSGTGIEKSGTGASNSGTKGRIGKSTFVLMAAAGLLMASLATAADSRLFVTERDDGLLISMQGSDGIVAGFSPLPEGGGGYYAVPLYSLVQFIEGQPAASPLVVGSGSGKEVVGSGSGGSGEVVGSGSGGSGEVVGSGSGSSGEQCILDPTLMVVGSGSGKEVVGSGSGSSSEVVGSGSGGSSEVVGSGSGASGESYSGCDAMGIWGYAEVLVEKSGVHVIVHQYVNGRFLERLVGLVHGVGTNDPRANERDFIAVP